MTAVEWLVDNLRKGEFISSPNELIEKAKQMEKEQIIDMYNTGYEDATCNHIKDAEQYYHQKYSHDSSTKS